MRYIIILILLCSIGYSVSIDNMTMQLYETAIANMKYYHRDRYNHELNVTKNEWVSNTMYNWLNDNISYKFYWRPRGISKTWYTMEGDCTDKAMILNYMLRKVNITSRLVHGIADDTLHDWVEYKDNGEWKNNDMYDFEYLKKIGNGVW